MASPHLAVFKQDQRGCELGTKHEIDKRANRHRQDQRTRRQDLHLESRSGRLQFSRGNDASATEAAIMEALTMESSISLRQFLLCSMSPLARCARASPHRSKIGPSRRVKGSGPIEGIGATEASPVSKVRAKAGTDLEHPRPLAPG